MTERAKYTATGRRGLTLNEDQCDFLRRRTTPFLNSAGMYTSIAHLMQEAYLQGLTDAAEALSQPAKEKTT